MAPSDSRWRPLAVCALLAAACDVPTGLPRWDTSWSVPARAVTVAVAQILPSGVTVAPDSGAFLVALSPVATAVRLSDQCAECRLVDGFTAPKPAFRFSTTMRTPLPANVTAGTLAAGTRVDLRVVNGLTFDPLRPSSAGASGYLLLVVRSGATVLARDSVDGAAVALPANGGTLARAITLGGGAVAGEVAAEVTVYSPAGDPVRMDASRQVSVTATPSPLRVTQAQVAVRGVRVSESSTTDLDVPAAVTERVRGGRLVLDVADPFGARGTLEIRASAPGADVRRTLQLTGRDARYEIALTEAELRSLFGATVTFTVSGPVSTAAPITVTPRQVVRIGTRLDFTLATQN